MLELETRRRIYTFIVDRPGVYLREIQRDLDLPMGMVEYHLGRLEGAGIVSVVHEDFKRYFPAQVPPLDRRHVGLLRQASCRRIVAHLLEHPGATHGELYRATGLVPSTLSYYLAKLAEAVLVVGARDGRQMRYRLHAPERLHALLLQYRRTFMDRVLDRFLEGLDEVHVAAPPPQDGETDGPGGSAS